MARLICKYRQEILFLCLVYFLGLGLRLVPRLGFDPHLLTFNADVWYRLSLAQYFSDYGRLPEFSLRYLAYGQVPYWYPPLSPIILSILSRLLSLDLPTICSRIIPFLEAATPLPFFFLVRYLYGRKAAFLATLILSLVPSFVYWTGIVSPQSLTLFLLPVYILMLVWRNDKRYGRLWESWRRRLFWVLALSVLLAINFLAHLTYFLAVIVLFLFAAGLKAERQLQRNSFLDLIYVVFLSQALTFWWWAPKNLYWWWVKALVTSSGLFSVFNQLIEYGILAASLGIFAVFFFLFILLLRPKLKRPNLVPIFFWLAFIFLETQNEAIMKLIHRVDLTWSPLMKPLEGFRFYCFLAQPLSLLTAVVISEYDPSYRSGRKAWRRVFLSILAIGLFLDIGLIYRLPQRWERSGITLSDYQAALWFRENSERDDRIVTDYYRAQMFAGVCAGRALLGGLFPLRNVSLPYVSRPAVVQDDIYTIYATDSASEAYHLMQKYQATHIYYFKHIDSIGSFGSKFRKGFGVKIHKDKFKNSEYFEQVYRQGDKAVIIKAKETGLVEPKTEFPYEPFFEGDIDIGF